MTNKETAQRCHKCEMAIPDGGQMLCMGVKPIALIDDVSDDDCPKHRVTPEAPADKKRPGRKSKAVKEPETKAALPDHRPDSDKSGQIQSDPSKVKARPIAVYRPKAPLEFVELGIQMPASEPKTEEADLIHHPRHYAWRGGLECIEIARELCRGSDGIAAYLIGCATKYIYRYPRKNGLQDLDKAIECLTMLRDIETKKGGDTDAR